MKKFLKISAIIVGVIIIISILAPSDDKKSGNSTTNGTGSVQSTEETSIQYNKYEITQLFDELDSNAMKAQAEHKGEYVEITGYLAVVDASGEYVSINAGEHNYDYLFDDIHLSIKDNDQKNTLMSKSKGDKLTVKCHITDVGEIMGYSADIIEIL